MPRLSMVVTQRGGLAANFQANTRAVQRATKQAVRETGVEHHTDLYVHAPRRTGFLASQTRLEFSDGGYTYTAGYYDEDFAAAGLASYFRYVRHGTRFMAANPWFDNADARARAAFKPRLRAALRATDRRGRR